MTVFIGVSLLWTNTIPIFIAYFWFWQCITYSSLSTINHIYQRHPSMNSLQTQVRTMRWISVTLLFVVRFVNSHWYEPLGDTASNQPTQSIYINNELMADPRMCAWTSRTNRGWQDCVVLGMHVHHFQVLIDLSGANTVPIRAWAHQHTWIHKTWLGLELRLGFS
jgi:hypothetical protein